MPRQSGLVVATWAWCALAAGCGSSPAGAQGGDDSGADGFAASVEGGGAGDAAAGDVAAPPEAGADGARDASDGAAASHYGVACSPTVRCPAGTQNVCLGASLGSYCSSFCMSDTDCAQGGVCVSGLFTGTNHLPAAVCLEGCSSSATCATGSFCDTTAGAPHCMPSDCRSAPSVCTATQTCNQDTGGCSETPLPAGYPATFPTAPVVSTYGGPTLTAPVLVPIFFSNDSDPTSPVADMVTFFQKVGGSNFWKALGEYGVGAPSSVVPVHLAQPAPAMLVDDPAGNTLHPLLASLIAGGGGIPAPEAQTLYILVFPATTSVTQGGNTAGGRSCPFLGYHDELPLSGGSSVAYAVVLRCTDPALGFATDLDGVTSTASHEIVEAVTDPFPTSAPALSNIDAHHGLLLPANPGTELGDMCEVDPEANFTFQDLAFSVQRFWSNAAAAAGRDPCVPAYPGETFFTGAPVLPNTTSFSMFGSTVASDSVTIPVGQSASVPLEFYSDAATGPWTVSVLDYQCYLGAASPDLLSVSLSAGTRSSCAAASNPMLPCLTQACTVQNGSTISARLTVNQAGNAATNGEPNSTELFAIISWENGSPTPTQHVSFGMVSN